MDDGSLCLSLALVLALFGPRSGIFFVLDTSVNDSRTAVNDSAKIIVCCWQGCFLVRQRPLTSVEQLMEDTFW